MNNQDTAVVPTSDVFDESSSPHLMSDMCYLGDGRPVETDADLVIPFADTFAHSGPAHPSPVQAESRQLIADDPVNLDSSASSSGSSSASSSDSSSSDAESPKSPKKRSSSDTDMVETFSQVALVNRVKKAVPKASLAVRKAREELAKTREDLAERLAAETIANAQRAVDAKRAAKEHAKQLETEALVKWQRAATEKREAERQERWRREAAQNNNAPKPDRLDAETLANTRRTIDAQLAASEAKQRAQGNAQQPSRTPRRYIKPQSQAESARHAEDDQLAAAETFRRPVKRARTKPRSPKPEHAKPASPKPVNPSPKSSRSKPEKPTSPKPQPSTPNDKPRASNKRSSGSKQPPAKKPAVRKSLHVSLPEELEGVTPLEELTEPELAERDYIIEVIYWNLFCDTEMDKDFKEYIMRRFCFSERTLTQLRRRHLPEELLNLDVPSIDCLSYIRLGKGEGKRSYFLNDDSLAVTEWLTECRDKYLYFKNEANAVLGMMSLLAARLDIFADIHHSARERLKDLCVQHQLYRVGYKYYPYPMSKAAAEQRRAKKSTLCALEEQ